jgi:hypothetical protein
VANNRQETRFAVNQIDDIKTDVINPVHLKQSGNNATLIDVSGTSVIHCEVDAMSNATTVAVPLPFELSEAPTRDDSDPHDIVRLREEIAKVYDPKSQTLIDNPPDVIQAITFTKTMQATYGGLDYKTDTALDPI